MARVPALVNPALLVWARQTAGYAVEDVARKLRVPPNRVAGWELGKDQPTISQAKRLAAMYHRPLAVFFLPSPPASAEPPPDYRRLPLASAGLSPRLRYEIRKARYRRETAVRLLEEAGESPVPFAVRADLGEPSHLVAQRLRDALAIPIEEQLKWRKTDQALKAWIGTIEDLGVLVFQTQAGSWGVQEDEMWGASIYETVFPAILLNGRLVAAAKTFTLMHELTHLALRTSGICDLDEREQIEVFCNRVAGEILVPRDALLAHIKEFSVARRPPDEEIGILADQYSVSREVIVRRLLILGRVTEGYYQAKRDQYRQEFLNFREAQKANEKPIFVPRARMIVRDNGVRYTGLVLHAYHESLIGLTDVSRYLGMNLKHLGQLEAAIIGAK